MRSLQLRRYPGLVLWPMVALAVLLGWAQAQEPPDRSPKIRMQVLEDSRRNGTVNDRRLILARQLIRGQDYQSASALLEELVAADSSNTVAANLLLRCYEQTKQYLKGEALIRSIVQRQPSDIGYRLQLAEILTLQGKDADGEQAYREAVALITRWDENHYRIVLSSMIDHGRNDAALALIDSLRLLRSDSTLFALETGSLLERGKRYADAAVEYYPVLVGDTTNDAVTAEKRPMRLLEFADASGEVERALLRAVEDTSNGRVLGLLASYYIRTGQFDKGFDFSIRQDSIDGRPGQAPMFFIQECRERRQFAQVVRMGEYLLAGDAEGAFVNEATFKYAEALAEIGRLDEAVAVYREAAATFPIERDRAEALCRIGEIFLDRAYQYDSALVYFRTAVTDHPRGFGYLRAQVSIPFCYLRLGDLEQARNGFTDLTRHRLNDDIAEQVQYYLALIDYVSHDYDSAEVSLRKLMSDYPRGFYINDAMRLVMLLADVEGDTASLNRYADALLYRERMLPDSAERCLGEILVAPRAKLADVALYDLAVLALEREDTAAALSHVDRIIDEFPESYFLPFGIKVKADVFTRRAEQVDEARRLYRQLLQDFPNYPFISDVRKRLRQLEPEALIG